MNMRRMIVTIAAVSSAVSAEPGCIDDGPTSWGGESSPVGVPPYRHGVVTTVESDAAAMGRAHEGGRSPLSILRQESDARRGVNGL